MSAHATMLRRRRVYVPADPRRYHYEWTWVPGGARSSHLELRSLLTFPHHNPPGDVVKLESPDKLAWCRLPPRR